MTSTSVMPTVFNNFMGDYGQENYHTDPIFAPYLKSNDLIPQHIMDALQFALVAPRNALQDLERTINVLYITLDAIERRHTHLETALSVYDPLMSPIRRLPDHMLEEIFYHCLPTDEYPGLSVTESPLLLTSVCKKWRSIAHNTPLLWNRIHILYYHPQHQVPGPKAHASWYRRNMAIEQWLLRSGDSCPLSLSLHPHESLPRNYDLHLAIDDVTSQMFSLIAKHAHRISALELSTSFGLLVAIERSITSSEDVHTFPKLHTLKLSLTQFSWQDITPSTIFLSSPSLRHVSVESDGTSIGIQTVAQHVQWGSLSRLFIHADQVDIAVVLNIVDKCRVSLEALSLNVASLPPNSSPQSSTPPAIGLPKLTTLHLHGFYSAAAKLCSLIEAPVLTHALFNLTSQTSAERPQPPRGLALFLERAPVSTLTINPCLLSPLHFQSLLEAVPRLATLIIDQNFLTQPDNHGSGYGYTPRVPLHPFGTRKPVRKREMDCLFDFREDRRLASLSNPFVFLEGPLLPDLRSLIIMEKTTRCNSVLPDAALLLSFIKSRLHKQDSNEDYHNTTASLELVKLILLPANPEYPDQLLWGDGVNIETSIAQHAESVGRRVGVDFKLQVSYDYDDEE